jgi:hypothetical protein
MSDDTTESDLFNGIASQGADLVIGEDFYDDDPDPQDSTYRDTGDPISQAVGSPGYMSAHVVGECFQGLGDGSQTEPEEFDRYYFPPQVENYVGPAPVLIDMIEAGDPAEEQQQRLDKHIDFKTRWCREHNVNYVVLSDTEDMMLSPEQLRARLTPGATPENPIPVSIVEPQAPAAAAAKRKAPANKARRKAGVQRIRPDAKG